MRPPSLQQLSVDPELAVLRALDVAMDMAVAVLMLFHPSGDDPEAEHCQSHQVAHRIINDAHRLRRALAEYQNALDLERATAGSAFPF